MFATDDQRVHSCAWRRRGGVACGGDAAGAAGQGSHRWPQFLPDGRRFLFSNGGGVSRTRDGAYVGSLDGGEPTRVMPAETAAAYAAPGYLLLVSQGVLAAYPFDAGARDRGWPSRRQWRRGLGLNDGARSDSAFSVSDTGRPGRIALAPALSGSSSGLARTGRDARCDIGPP